MNAKTWFVDINGKSLIICGCILQSSYKKHPIKLPGNKYKKINTMLAL